MKDISDVIAVIKQENKRAAASLTKKKGFAVFDFDYTTITNDIADLILFHLCQEHQLKNPNLLGKPQPLSAKYHQKIFNTYWKLHKKGDIKSFELITKALAGFSIKEIERLVKEVIQTNQGKGTWYIHDIELPKGVRARTEIEIIMEILTEHNIDIHIVSASPQVIVDAAVKILLPKLKIQIHGITQDIHQNILTSKIHLPMPAYQGKVTCIKTFAPKEKPFLAVGDSFNDEYMLKYAKNKVVINRQSKFTAFAQKNGWILL